jgi:alginate O-acetyltransferase complex protein AlgI
MELINYFFSLFRYDASNPLIFNSGSFLIFFAILLLVYNFYYRNRLMRSLVMVVFSLFFYYKLSGLSFLIILLPLVSDFIIAKKIHKSTSQKTRRYWLIASVTINLLLLVLFKYLNFFGNIVASIEGSPFTPFSLIMPVGISYYVFRTISYVVDVYREDIKPETDILEFAFYITFFPLLTAGPITRASEFLPQLQKKPVIDHEKIYLGLYLIMQGLVKKAVIADYLAQYNNLVFDAPGTYSGFETLMAVYGYTAQIYFDFSGYTDMAIGIATILGFNIGINFNKPYHALNLTDFWRRWHISLSTWLRDYLFSPMSLKFRNAGTTGIITALVFTFVICGFWHGPNFTFILWGALNGLIMAFEIITSKWRRRIKKKIPTRIYTSVSWFITFNLLAFLWIVFRSSDLKSAWLLIQRIFTDTNIAYLQPFVHVRTLFVIILLAGFAMYALPTEKITMISKRFIAIPYWAKAIVFIALVQLIIQLQGADVQPFLYAGF